MIEKLTERDKQNFVRVSKPESKSDRAVMAIGMWWPNTVCRMDEKGMVWVEKGFYNKKVDALVEGFFS
jgi:hypothetical protein